MSGWLQGTRLKCHCVQKETGLRNKPPDRPSSGASLAQGRADMLMNSKMLLTPQWTNRKPWALRGQNYHPTKGYESYTSWMVCRGHCQALASVLIPTGKRTWDPGRHSELQALSLDSHRPVKSKFYALKGLLGLPPMQSPQPATAEDFHNVCGFSPHTSRSIIATKDPPVEPCRSISAQTTVPGLVRCLLIFILSYH